MARNMKSSITALAGLLVVPASVMAIDSSLTSIIPKRTLDEDKNITLRTGIILAPPFAMETEEGPGNYYGYEIDLLSEIQDVAEQDGYHLTFDLELSPQRYTDAFDLVANDCNTTVNPNPLEECQRFDLIVGDYFRTADRSVRVDLSPTILHTAISSINTIKDADQKKYDIPTLTQLQAQGGTACIPAGTSTRAKVMGRFPDINYLDCPNPGECLNWLKEGKCSLYASSEVLLEYNALVDPQLEVTGEQFYPQYIVWPVSYNLDAQTSRLLKKWMYGAFTDIVLERLRYKYFSIKLCQPGLSGKNCDQSCDRKNGQSDRDGTCICKSTKWTGDDCSIEVQENLNLYPSWEIALCYALFGINALSCITCAVWIHWKRSNKLVQLSQPFFLNLILLGCVISSSAIIPLVQQSAGDGPVYACAVFPWLFCVGFSITFGTLFAKIRRIYKLFKASAQATKVTVTQKETLIIICLITSVDVFMCIIWTAVDPLYWTREVTSTDQFGEPLESVGYCTGDHWKAFLSIIAAWHLALLFSACYLCYKARHISSRFVESKSLVLAIISHLQIYLISIPVLLLIGNDPVSNLFIRSVVIWINDFAIIIIIFGGLMYSVHTHQGDDFNVNQAISTYSSSTGVSSGGLQKPSLDRTNTVADIRARAASRQASMQSSIQEDSIAEGQDEWDDNAGVAKKEVKFEPNLEEN